MKRCAVVAMIGSLSFLGCGGDDEGGSGQADPAELLLEDAASEETGDRGRFNDEADGVRAVVADCFVREASDGSRRYSTTVEVDNDSGDVQLVTVTVVSDLGWGGVSDTFEVPAGGQDAWGITSEAATSQAVGDVDCVDYISSIVVTVESPD